MPARPLAHSANDDGTTHDLEAHLNRVAQLAAEFAKAFDSRDYARAAGVWHDLGKNAPDFQARLAGSADAHVEDAAIPGRVDHSSAGALHALQRLGRGIGLPLAFVIAGHHAGLPDLTDLDARLATKQPRLDAARCNPAAVLLDTETPKPPTFLRAPALTSADETKRRYEFWVRMLFSCLVDGDFLDTEEHFDGRKACQRGDREALRALRERLNVFMRELQDAAEPTDVNRVRARLLQDCRDAATRSQGVFSLTAPTGCGKTLAGMAFALEHAIEHDLQRVIVVIPYTSIIDQNAAEYRKVLGADNVIDHHASLDPKKETHRNRIACENWDAPVIVTTIVQFLESLLANQTARCRKLHNIVESVVIFDEVQTLPIDHLIPIVDVLKELVRHYRTSIVLSTATQPALKHRLSDSGQVFPGFESVSEIVRDVPGTFQALRRVDVHFPESLDTPITWEALASEIAKASEDDLLVVVHKRQDARVLAGLIPGSVHLSALMCAAHRLSTIETVKAELALNQQCRENGRPVVPVRLIATQLVEAGVNLDFPVLYRALGGFDAVAQAAGRCNREGRLQGRRGQVRLFVAPTNPPRGTPADGLAVARSMIAADRAAGSETDPLDPARFDGYFRRLYFGRQLDRAGIQAKRASWQFRTVASDFQMIEDDGSEPVVVLWADAGSRLDQLRNHGPSRDRLRALQPFVVTVYPTHRQSLEDAGAIEQVADTVWALKPSHAKLYDARFGLKSEGPYPADPNFSVV